MGTTPREAASRTGIRTTSWNWKDSDSDLHGTGESKPSLNGKEAGGEGQRRGRLSAAGVAAGDRKEGEGRKPGLLRWAVGNLSSKPVSVTFNRPGLHLDV